MWPKEQRCQHLLELVSNESQAPPGPSKSDCLRPRPSPLCCAVQDSPVTSAHTAVLWRLLTAERAALSSKEVLGPAEVTTLRASGLPSSMGLGGLLLGRTNRVCPSQSLSFLCLSFLRDPFPQVSLWAPVVIQHPRSARNLGPDTTVLGTPRGGLWLEGARNVHVEQEVALTARARGARGRGGSLKFAVSHPLPVSKGIKYENPFLVLFKLNPFGGISLNFTLKPAFALSGHALLFSLSSTLGRQVLAGAPLLPDGVRTREPGGPHGPPTTPAAGRRCGAGGVKLG